MMPGRLLGFARGSFSSSDVKAPLRESLQRAGSSNGSSTASSLFDSKSDKSMDEKHHLKMPHLGKKHSDKKVVGSPKLTPQKSVTLGIKVESPPLVSFNSPAQSSGALFSAQVVLNVVEKQATISKFDIDLQCAVTVKRPVSDKCPDCARKTTTLKSWDFAKEPLVLSQGEHRFPFSYLFGGHLPATTNAGIATLDYHVTATVKTSTNEVLTMDRPIDLKRAILPGNDKHSIRIFPPTNLTAAVSLNPIVYPIGEFPIHLRLSGITTKQKDSQSRWRVRKMNWRIEEHQKMISPACAKHAAKVGGEGRGMQHEDVKIIGEAEIDSKKTPWKTDFDSGEVEVEFMASTNASLQPVCDVEAPNGLSVSHNLVVEIVVAEEWAPNRRPTQATPTGAARILRMQFHLHMTQRAGMGISWDEEQPPVYEDVPDSPPAYSGNMTTTTLSEIEGQIEDFHLGEPLHYNNSSNNNMSHPSPRMMAATTRGSSMSPAVRPINANGDLPPSPAYTFASPRMAATLIGAAGSSSSSSSALGTRGGSHSGQQRPRFTVDDFLSEPNYPVRPENDGEEEEEEIDQQAGQVA